MQRSYGSNSPDAIERIFQGPLNWVNLCLIGLNIIVFIVAEVFGDTNDVEYMLRIGAANTPYILDGDWYRLITSMFLHFGLEHLMNNMILLLLLGDMLEELVGKWKYFLIYILGGLLGNLLSMQVDLYTGDLSGVSAGASGAAFAVLGAFFVVLLKQREALQEISVGRVFFVLFFSIYNGFQSTGINNVAHIGGAIGGMILAMILYHNNNRPAPYQKEDGPSWDDRNYL